MNTDLAEAILSQKAPNSKPEWYADILQRLVWLTADNGHEICNTLKQWLVGDDKFKVEVSLYFTDVYLWETSEEMNELLSAVETKFPDLKPVTSSIRKQYQERH